MLQRPQRGGSSQGGEITGQGDWRKTALNSTTPTEGPGPAPPQGGLNPLALTGSALRQGSTRCPRPGRQSLGKQEGPDLPGVRAEAHPSERLLHGAPAQGPEVGCSEQQDAPYPRGPD